jgi:predicted phosphodiesterase
MKVAVISDLHLGTGGPTDLFGHDDSEFLKFLDFLESNFEKVVLLGDIWETLTAATPRGQVEELKRAQAAHREIHRRFERPRYKYVHGNHDLVAGRVHGVSEEYTLNSDGVRMVFSHGHQGDRLCSRARSVSEWGVWVGGFLRRFGLNCLYSYLARLESGRLDSKKSGCRVKAWALTHAATRSADLVVTGHTHHPIKSEEDGRLFLNSGACARGRLSFLSLDTKRGDYAVNHGF